MPEDELNQQSVPRPFWSGTISFGLVSIPVDLFPANRSSHVSLRMLGPNGTPLRRRYFSANSDKELAPEKMVRGYEIHKDKYVMVTDEELDKLAPERSHDIDLQRFVSEDSIPPLYFERGYFLAPAEESTKAYKLLAAVMEKTQRAGVATFVMRGKEYLTAIVAENGILRAETLRFKDEIRSPADLGLPEKSKVDEKLVHRFEQIIGKKSARELSSSELHDETAAALLAIVKKKQARKEDIVESGEANGEGPQGDLFDALKRSLSGHAGARSKRQPQSHRWERSSRSRRASAPKRARGAKRRRA